MKFFETLQKQNMMYLWAESMPFLSHRHSLSLWKYIVVTSLLKTCTNHTSKEPKDKHPGRFIRGDHFQEITQPGSALSHSVRYLSSQEQTIKTQFYCPFAKPKPAAILSPVWDLVEDCCSAVNRCLLDSLQHCQLIWLETFFVAVKKKSAGPGVL